MSITKRMLGLKKSPVDKRDYVARPLLTPYLYKLPVEFDLTGKQTPVRSQGQEGSCVGFAMVCGVKEYQEQKERKKFVNLSPRYLYEAAKRISGHSEGTTLKAAMQVAQKLGTCEESYWPYIAQQPGTPKKGAEENALKYRIKSYARIRTTDELKAALINPEIGDTLVGVTVYSGMVSDEAKRTGVVTDPTCWDKMKALGGHALCAVAYNDVSPYFKNDGHIKVKNSWGKEFGDKGYLYLSYKNITANMIDCYTSIDIVDASEIQLLGVAPVWEK